MLAKSEKDGFVLVSQGTGIGPSVVLSVHAESFMLPVLPATRVGSIINIYVKGATYHESVSSSDSI